MHNKRMKDLGKWAVPPAGSKQGKIIDKLVTEQYQQNPELIKQSKKIYKEALAHITVQHENGAGLPADTIIREYNKEYSERAINMTLSDMPSSFNVAEAFNKFSPPPFIFQMCEENDYLFSFTDFLDFVTSDEAPEDTKELSNFMQNGVTYSFNSLDDPLDNLFSTTNNIEFGVQSVSLIKHDNEVSILLLGGQKCDLNKESLKLKEEFEEYRNIPSHKNIKPNETLTVEAVPLLEGKELWRTIVLVRIDIETSTIDARYVYKDTGVSFLGVTDDIVSYLNHEGKLVDDLEDIWEKNIKNVDVYSPLFELCKTSMYLPYFKKSYEDVISVERHPTTYFSNTNKLKYRKINKLVGRKYKVTFRNVEKISTKNRRQPAYREFVTPDIKIETSGYWKKIDYQSEGRDKNNQPIQGRTWVSKTLTWKESSNSNGTLQVRRDITPNSSEHGYIYIMRSAAHDKDIFKVGLTRRNSEIRSKELSRTTGSPDHFLVVEDWEVSDCVLAEKMIHERLSEYRINPKREFFQVRYKVIFKVIDEVIESLSKNT